MHGFVTTCKNHSYLTVETASPKCSQELIEITINEMFSVEKQPKLTAHQNAGFSVVLETNKHENQECKVNEIVLLLEERNIYFPFC